MRGEARPLFDFVFKFLRLKRSGNVIMRFMVFFLLLMLLFVVGGGEHVGVSFYHKLFDKVERDPMPLFDFGSDLDHIIKLNQNSDLEAKIIYEQYVERLIAHYYQEYVTRVQTTTNVQRMKVTQAIIIKEFDTAMKAALPKSKQDEWSTIVSSYSLQSVSITHIFACYLHSPFYNSFWRT
ncbi:hypothetical protein EON65_00355 [archaeon]|nr:MAG: hypothetical protein EON65_00355 [archaeon]